MAKNLKTDIIESIEEANLIASIGASNEYDNIKHLSYADIDPSMMNDTDEDYS